jgi:hypothetical protein
MRCLKDQHEAGRPSSLWRSPTARPSMQGRHSTEHSRQGTVEWVCAPTCQVLPGMEPRPKWRSPANSWGRRRLDAAGLHRRKDWQTGGLRSSAVGCGPGEMALSTLEKAPFCAIFPDFFADFLQVFLRVFSSGRKRAPFGAKTRGYGTMPALPPTPALATREGRRAPIGPETRKRGVQDQEMARKCPVMALQAGWRGRRKPRREQALDHFSAPRKMALKPRKGAFQCHFVPFFRVAVHPGRAWV